MKQFLKRFNLPKFTQEETHNLNRPIFLKNIESIMNTILKEKAPGITDELHQTFKEGIIPILFHLFHKIKAEKIFSNFFYQESITQIQKPKTEQERESTD